MELLRTWHADAFHLYLYYAGTGCGRVRLAYRFYDGPDLIFDGDDFYPSPLYAYDDDHAVAALLGFLALQPGDTDAAYFTRYTEPQLEWAKRRGEALKLAALHCFGEIA